MAAPAFGMTMQGHTIVGDVYTFSEYQQMFRNAGNSSSELHAMPGPMSVIILKI